MTSVLQAWVQELPMMQQSVLLTAVRGPDGLPKYHSSKYLLRWYRRCILLSAMDGRVLHDPVERNGGSFTGPSVLHSRVTPNRYAAISNLRDGASHIALESGMYHESALLAMSDWVTTYLRDLDEVPHHFQLHFMHAAEIVGYKHPADEIRFWWADVYYRLVNDMHLSPETPAMLDHRLADSRSQWLEHADAATQD